MKPWFGALLLSCFTGTVGPRALPNVNTEVPSKAELRISASVQKFHAGDAPVVIRIELHNLGEDDFIIGNSFVGNLSARSYVLVDVKDDSGKHYTLDSGFVCGLGISYFAKSWIRVEPSHYYGIEFPLNPEGYHLVTTSGRYQLTATYYSSGDNTPASPEWDVPSYPVWKGKIVSNTISLEVAANKSDTADTKDRL
ncbi:MAG TPA: hypothetical protein VEG64_08930 [Candidatus Sulfotelmatobacter sp.]|nr:hypothetical protein [Candidatus Sulfotelmatobacter sp.]